MSSVDRHGCMSDLGPIRRTPQFGEEVWGVARSALRFEQHPKPHSCEAGATFSNKIKGDKWADRPAARLGLEGDAENVLRQP